MLRINQLKLPINHTVEQLQKKIIKIAHIKDSDLIEYYIKKKSIDARKKQELCYVYSIDFSAKHEQHILSHSKGKIIKAMDPQYMIPAHGNTELKNRPVIVGFGPAGLFCAYLLAKEGYHPLIIERGAPVHERMQDVDQFWSTGSLKPNSNVQFGEGGAGTFSDGKLNTLVKDKNGRNRFVLETLVKFGAPEHILWEQKPHIGTDILIHVVENMRNEIIALGGDVCFHSQLTNLDMDKQELTINSNETMNTDALVLAIGHSARDTFQMMYESGIYMESKSFAVGVRAEHPQSWINEAMYGADYKDLLPAAPYKLTTQLDNGRGVYTFCMCPGGYVVNASSEPNRLAVNGMSYSDRAGENANSAIIVTVTPEDFGSDHPLAGMEFQRMLEENAWKEGQQTSLCNETDTVDNSMYTIPVQKFSDYKKGEISTKLGSVSPNIKGAWAFGNVRNIFPADIALSIEQGIINMGKKIAKFDNDDILLSGVESRTSSPIKVFRNEEFVCNMEWIYPCGEGAGYAGGITSAAMDGLKVAEAIIKKYNSF